MDQVCHESLLDAQRHIAGQVGLAVKQI